MSKELEPLSDPGLPEHIHRKADIDPIAAKRAERQVAVLFSLSAFGTILFIYSFFFVKEDVFIFLPILGNTNAHQLGIGLGMAFGLFFIGIGAVHWAKTLMPDQEVIAQRHEFKSEPQDRDAFVKAAKEGAEVAGLGRRPLIKRTLIGAAALAGLPGVLMLRDLGPLPGKELEKTNWKSGTRLVTDPGDRPIKASDLEVGAVAQVLPELLPGQKRTLEDIGKDAVLLIRLRPSEFQLNEERLSWTHEGIIAFSKICSHMGCAVALYEQTTKHLLCPCHQSTFDVTRAAKVIFGPAARPLPQLAITVDAEGNLIAKQPFTEAVGPSFWE
ncbi:MAG: Rieske 2Fe-2S domain-containing protein, partial [Actinobacteria bacterium]|nr:Rieske 2Fe-2S domain-containing protein [Actinomycetota bacterium]